MDYLWKALGVQEAARQVWGGIQDVFYVKLKPTAHNASRRIENFFVRKVSNFPDSFLGPFGTNSKILPIVREINDKLQGKPELYDLYVNTEGDILRNRRGTSTLEMIYRGSDKRFLKPDRYISYSVNDVFGVGHSLRTLKDYVESCYSSSFDTKLKDIFPLEGLTPDDVKAITSTTPETALEIIFDVLGMGDIKKLPLQKQADLITSLRDDIGERIKAEKNSGAWYTKETIMNMINIISKNNEYGEIVQEMYNDLYNRGEIHWFWEYSRSGAFTMARHTGSYKKLKGGEKFYLNPSLTSGNPLIEKFESIDKLLAGGQPTLSQALKNRSGSIFSSLVLPAAALAIAWGLPKIIGKIAGVKLTREQNNLVQNTTQAIGHVADVVGQTAQNQNQNAETVAQLTDDLRLTARNFRLVGNAMKKILYIQGIQTLSLFENNTQARTKIHRCVGRLVSATDRLEDVDRSAELNNIFDETDNNLIKDELPLMQTMPDDDSFLKKQRIVESFSKKYPTKRNFREPPPQRKLFRMPKFGQCSYSYYSLDNRRYLVNFQKIPDLGTDYNLDTNIRTILMNPNFTTIKRFAHETGQGTRNIMMYRIIESIILKKDYPDHNLRFGAHFSDANSDRFWNYIAYINSVGNCDIASRSDERLTLHIFDDNKNEVLPLVPQQPRAEPTDVVVEPREVVAEPEEIVVEPENPVSVLNEFPEGIVDVFNINDEVVLENQINPLEEGLDDLESVSKTNSMDNYYELYNLIGQINREVNRFDRARRRLSSIWSKLTTKKYYNVFFFLTF